LQNNVQNVLRDDHDKLHLKSTDDVGLEKGEMGKAWVTTMGLQNTVIK
jgi:hypothetical protein